MELMIRIIFLISGVESDKDEDDKKHVCKNCITHHVSVSCFAVQAGHGKQEMLQKVM